MTISFIPSGVGIQSGRQLDKEVDDTFIHSTVVFKKSIKSYILLSLLASSPVAFIENFNLFWRTKIKERGTNVFDKTNRRAS